MKIAITGSTGLIGSRIVELLQNKFEFIPLLSDHLEIENASQVTNHLTSIDYDIMLHIAAYTNVDRAEQDKEFAYKLNVEGTRNLFDITQKKGKKFIYFSTDFVFDGNTPPFDEDSTPNPISVYGQTKYEGEKVVAGKAMIIRPSYPYRQTFDKKRDFVRTVKKLLEDGQELQMVTDSSITPTFIDDIAMSMKYLIYNFQPEVYHLVGPDSISPYEAGKLIAQTFKLNEELIKPTTYEEYFKDKAKRPQYSEMKTKKNQFPMTPFKEGLEKVI